MVIKNGKCVDQRMCRPEVAMTFIIGCDDPIEEEAENIASRSVAPAPLQEKEMTLRFQQDDKVHAFLEGTGFRQLARREVAQALT